MSAAGATTTTAALRSNWRKVSSTDNLQAFAVDDGLEQCVAQQGSHRSRAIGLGMMMLAALLIVAELSVLVAKLVSKPTWKPLQTLQADSYYIYLVPLMVPMAAVGVTLNWFSLKLFKHNS